MAAIFESKREPQRYYNNNGNNINLSSINLINSIDNESKQQKNQGHEDRECKIKEKNTKDDKGWTCLACTYENHAQNALTRCEICLVPRPVIWACRKCGITNASKFRSLENDHLCRKCSEKNDDIEKLKVARKIDGNWDCPKCSSNNYYTQTCCTTCKYDHLEIDDIPEEFRAILSSSSIPSTSVGVGVRVGFSFNSRSSRTLSSSSSWLSSQTDNPYLHQSKFLNGNKPQEKKKIVEVVDGFWICPQCSMTNSRFKTSCTRCLYEPYQLALDSISAEDMAERRQRNRRRRRTEPDRQNSTSKVSQSESVVTPDGQVSFGLVPWSEDENSAHETNLWSCSKCTAHNHLIRPFCHVCNHGRFSKVNENEVPTNGDSSDNGGANVNSRSNSEQEQET